MANGVDIAIVGGGAAGLTAAIFARRTAPRARIVLLDVAPRLGAKILISGGGRCNVTHHAVSPDDFNGNRNAVAKVLRSFPVERTVDWFASMGVELKREASGKLFPVTDRAKSVLDALLAAAEGVEIRTSRRVAGLTRPGNGYEVAAGGETLTASRVILATGGRSVPKTGSDGSGFALAASLGHSVSDLFPALVPLVLEHGHPLTRLSGTSAEVELALRSPGGRVLIRQRGSMLCTHFGLSGPVVLDVSRHWIAGRRRGEGSVLVCSFLPDQTFESLEAQLVEASRSNPRTTASSLFRSRMPERLVAAAGALSGVDVAVPLGTLPRKERRALVRALLELPLPVTRDRGFDFAEVTAGGVPLSEVETATMESRKAPGLFLCGEILDVDGRIGGFNFQWAWATGRLAGIAAAGAAVGDG